MAGKDILSFGKLVLFSNPTSESDFDGKLVLLVEIVRKVEKEALTNDVGGILIKYGNNEDNSFEVEFEMNKEKVGLGSTFFFLVGLSNSSSSSFSIFCRLALYQD